MTCVKPFVVGSGKVTDYGSSGLKVPCGRCMACRIARTREWMVRLLNEMEYDRNACFVTLTYSDDNLPSDNGLSKLALKNFIRRLEYYVGKKLRYFAVGEYGERTSRPHYHGIFIGWKPSFESLNKHGRQYSSKEIESIWKKGNNVVGTVNKESIQYVTGYVRKKLYGKEGYGKLQPPFQLVSRGLGSEFAKSHYRTFVSERGYTLNGKNVGVPRYYKKIFDKIDPEINKVFRDRSEEKNVNEISIYGSLLGRDIAEFKDAERREANLKAREEIAKARAKF